MVRDPVCGMEIDPTRAVERKLHEGTTYYFCSPGCAAKFAQDPQRYVSSERARASNRAPDGAA